MRKSFVLYLLIFIGYAASAQVDLAVSLPFGSIMSPVSGCGLTSTENVTISIFNFGNTLPAATTFNVSYTINAGLPVTEMVTLGAPLTSNSRLVYTFTTQANLSTPGTYTFDASVSIAGDVSPANDARTGYTVTNYAPAVGGSVSGSTTVPAGSNSGTVVLSGHTGQVQRWELSRDGGTTWLWVSNTTTSQAYLNLTETTMYRARLINGPCSNDYSSTATITVTAPLPLGLTAIDAVNVGSRNKIGWNLADVSNVVSFEVERSADGKNFEKIETVPVHESTPDYLAYDRSPLAGITYYRVKVLEKSGAHTYSAVVSALMKNSNDFAVNAYPNPVTDRLHIDVQGAANGTLILTDIVGAQKVHAAYSAGAAEINMSSLSSGVYFLKCSNGVSIKTLKLMKY